MLVEAALDIDAELWVKMRKRYNLLEVKMINPLQSALRKSARSLPYFDTRGCALIAFFLNRHISSA